MCNRGTTLLTRAQQTHHTYFFLRFFSAFFFRLVEHGYETVLLGCQMPGCLPLAWFSCLTSSGVCSTTQRTADANLEGKSRMLATNFSKNTKFTVRNARCFANLSIKIILKTLCTVCTNFATSGRIFMHVFRYFLCDDFFFSSNELKCVTRCGNVLVTLEVCVLQCHLIWWRWYPIDAPPIGHMWN